MALNIMSVIWKHVLPERHKNSARSIVREIVIDTGIVIGVVTLAIISVRAIRRQRRKILAAKVQ